jgi:pyruvate kinase
MLSAESAMGDFPVESVAMLSRIAATVEATRRRTTVKEMYANVDLTGKILPLHLISVGVEASLEYLKPAAIFARTDSGASARRLAGFRLPVWTVAITPNAKTAQDLLFSSGVIPVHHAEPPASWNGFVKEWVKGHDLPGGFAILTEGPSANDQESNHRMEIINL